MYRWVGTTGEASDGTTEMGRRLEEGGIDGGDEDDKGDGWIEEDEGRDIVVVMRFLQNRRKDPAKRLSARRPRNRIRWRSSRQPS